MNKQTFLDLLTTKYLRVGVPEPAVSTNPPMIRMPSGQVIQATDKDGNPLLSDFDKRKNELGESFYLVGVLYKTGNRTKHGNVYFHVVDEGLPTEEVYWEEKELPEFLLPDIDTTFEDAAEAKVQESRPAGYLTHEFLEINKKAANPYAKVRMWKDTANKATPIDFFLVFDGTVVSITPL